jgi:hypothetical protein
MRTIKAPGAFPDADKINVRKINADDEQAVLEFSKEIIGRGADQAISSYLQTHEKRIAMLKNNGFAIEGDVELKATQTIKEEKMAEKKKLLLDFIQYVNLHSPSIQVSEMETFIDDFFSGPRNPEGEEMAPKG